MSDLFCQSIEDFFLITFLHILIAQIFEQLQWEIQSKSIGWSF